ncbi:ABC transporter substrate-binding protein [Actinorhabdospora filicis]|uniref:ABC transporter substrate-binding protein n=1 Tax=Actinorhabdospora filicis TaxID=1785913 RepID=A0A9W6W8J5_9ACTN|nr:helical backbone metal receptor [Actinorhabdospora filicis]GLZ75740.1 ABC transporter substrate-binding protein [Actinorhabdospora filicis]
MIRDDLGEPYTAGPPRRVVSLVPSTTEAVAPTGLLVGATDYCTHPADLAVARVGGSKYPALEKILALRPDVVLANAEENRREDVEALRAAGLTVWVSLPRTVEEALDAAARMFAHALHLPEPAWIAAAREAWREPVPATRRAAVPIWRKPWMVAGAGTFAADVLLRLGVTNVFEGATYPKTTPGEILALRPDLIVLPDEPYAFTAQDGPEAFPGVPCALVSGRHLTWHGPSLVEAREVLAAALVI